MADILLFPSTRPITKAEPRGDSAHVHLLSVSADAEKRARFERVFGARVFGNRRPSGARAHGVRRSPVSHEAWLAWFHLVHFLLSLGGMAAALLARLRAANFRTIGAGAGPRQTMDASKLSTFKSDARQQEGEA